MAPTTALGRAQGRAADAPADIAGLSMR